MGIHFSGSKLLWVCPSEPVQFVPNCNMRRRVQLLPVKKTAKQKDTLDWMSREPWKSNKQSYQELAAKPIKTWIYIEAFWIRPNHLLMPVRSNLLSRGLTWNYESIAGLKENHCIRPFSMTAVKSERTCLHETSPLNAKEPPGLTI